MQIESDQELIEQAKRGAREAFEALVIRYQDFMVNFIYRMTQDKDAALDQAQESFVKAYKAIASFKEQSSFRTWLGSIAINTTRTYLSKKKNETTVDILENIDSKTVPTPEDELQKNQLKNRIRNALMKLKSDQQDVVKICAIEGFSYSEAAQMLKIPLGTVCSRMNAALSELRVLLSKEVENG